MTSRPVSCHRHRFPPEIIKHAVGEELMPNQHTTSMRWKRPIAFMVGHAACC